MDIAHYYLMQKLHHHMEEAHMAHVNLMLELDKKLNVVMLSDMLEILDHPQVHTYIMKYIKTTEK